MHLPTNMRWLCGTIVAKHLQTLKNWPTGSDTALHTAKYTPHSELIRAARNQRQFITAAYNRTVYAMKFDNSIRDECNLRARRYKKVSNVITRA